MGMKIPPERFVGHVAKPRPELTQSIMNVQMRVIFITPIMNTWQVYCRWQSYHVYQYTFHNAWHTVEVEIVTQLVGASVLYSRKQKGVVSETQCVSSSSSDA